MQEEVNEKTISLCIKGGKITAQILKAALIKLLAEMDKKKKQQQKGKGQCKRTGKQSIKSLQKSGAQITNIVVTEKGASLKAAGYTCEGRAGGLEWNGVKAPKQADQYPHQMKTRWVKKKEGLHGS